MPRTRSLGALALVAGLLVAACGGAAPSASTAAVASPAPTPAPTASPSPEPTPCPTPSPTPEPTPDLEAIGAAYLAIAEMFQAEGQPLINQIADGGSYTEEEWAGFHQKVADTYDKAMAELDKIDFPDEIAEDIAGIRASWVKVRDLFLAVVDDPSLDMWDDFIAEADSYGARADRVREYLGLPPRPTPPPG